MCRQTAGLGILRKFVPGSSRARHLLLDKPGEANHPLEQILRITVEISTGKLLRDGEGVYGWTCWTWVKMSVRTCSCLAMSSRQGYLERGNCMHNRISHKSGKVRKARKRVKDIKIKMSDHGWRFLTFCESHWRPSNRPSPVVAQL